MKKLALGSLVFVAVYNLLFFQTDNGVGTGLLFLLLNLFYFLFKKNDSPNINLGISCSILSTVFGFLMGFRANEVVRFINLISAVFFSTSALYFYKNSFIFSFEIPKFLQIPVVALTSSISSALSLFSSKDAASENKETGIYTALTRGLVISVPLFLILLFLLTKADPIFNKLVSNLFSDIWQRLIVSVVIFVGLVASGATIIREKVKEHDVTRQDASHKSYELMVILGCLSFLFAAFLIVQFNYFFSNAGERELLELGITSLTYSEYVRKGFFELLAVSGIAACVMLYVLKFLHKLSGNQKLYVQILSSVLILEIVFLLISAGQRINLYQLAHGLTRARIFGFIFLIWLGCMLSALLVRIMKDVEKKMLFALFIIPTVGVLFFINTINIDGLIATIYKPSVNNEVDYYYLVYLSEDASPSWQEAIKDSEKTLQKLEPSKSFSTEEYRQLYWARYTLERLDNEVTYLSQKYGDYSKIKMTDEENRKYINRIRKWQSFNLGEYQSYMEILQNKDVYDQVNALLQKATGFENARVTDSIRQSAPLDRATQPPLL